MINFKALSDVSNHICQPNGFGHQIAIWHDGTWTEAASGNDIINARARITRPMSPQQIERSLVEQGFWE